MAAGRRQRALLLPNLLQKGQRQSYQNDWLIELRFYVPPDTKYFILETFFPANLLA